MDPNAPILTAVELDKLLDATDEEAKAVLGRMNARKQNKAMYYPMVNFTNENHFGFKALVERGSLGLVPTAL
jgi:hypothetical protein